MTRKMEKIKIALHIPCSQGWRVGVFHHANAMQAAGRIASGRGLVLDGTSLGPRWDVARDDDRFPLDTNGLCPLMMREVTAVSHMRASR